MSDINNYNPLRPNEFCDTDSAAAFTSAAEGLFIHSYTFGWLLLTGDDSHKYGNVDIIIFAREFAERKVAGYTQLVAEDAQSNGADLLQAMIDEARLILKTDYNTERELFSVDAEESKADSLAKSLLWRNAPNMYSRVIDGEDVSANALLELLDLLSDEEERSADADEFLSLVQDITEEAQFDLELIYG